MYLIMASVWYQCCARWWKYTHLLTHNRALLNGIRCLAEGFASVGTTTGTIRCSCAVICIPFHHVTWQDDSLNRAIVRYGNIILQSRLDLSMLQWYSWKDVTQSINCFSMPRLIVGRLLGTIKVIWKMHFIFQLTSSEVPTTWSSRYCLASYLSALFPWVRSIIFWKYCG